MYRCTLHRDFMQCAAYTVRVCMLLNGLQDESLVLSENIHILDPLLEPLTWLQEEGFLALNEFLLTQLWLSIAADWVKNYAILPVGQRGDVGHTHNLVNNNIRYMTLPTWVNTMSTKERGREGGRGGRGRERGREGGRERRRGGREGGGRERRRTERKGGREGYSFCSHIFVNIRDMCLCVLHLDEPLLPIPVSHSIAVGEGTSGLHMQCNL